MADRCLTRFAHIPTLSRLSDFPLIPTNRFCANKSKNSIRRITIFRAARWKCRVRFSIFGRRQNIEVPLVARRACKHTCRHRRVGGFGHCRALGGCRYAQKRRYACNRKQGNHSLCRQTSQSSRKEVRRKNLAPRYRTFGNFLVFER